MLIIKFILHLALSCVVVPLMKKSDTAENAEKFHAVHNVWMGLHSTSDWMTEEAGLLPTALMANAVVIHSEVEIDLSPSKDCE